MRQAFLLCFITFFGAASYAQDRPSGLARLEPGSIVSDSDDGLQMILQLSQPVPYRVYHLTDPWRVIMEFSELDFTPISTGSLVQSSRILGLRSGAVRPGWTRLVMEMDRPMLVEEIEQVQRANLGATIVASIVDVEPARFEEQAGLPTDLRQRKTPASQPAAFERPEGPFRIMIDPGHGGIDPGAVAGEIVEADLMLRYGRALQEALIRTGAFDVRLTRNDNYFVPLETRVSLAHEFHADLFVSLHADVVLEGQASGAAIYTLSEEASDVASQKLAERHSREDLLAGVDLSQQDDGVAFVLMDLARTETMHRTSQLADTLVEALGEQVELYKKPRLEAGFSVLKAPDIPSILIELGFMSSKRDLKNLTDAEWQERAIAGLVAGIVAWVDRDLAEKPLRKK